jgi:hypothetical protein
MLQRVRFLSQERLDLPDLFNLDSFQSTDWAQFFQSFMAATPFIVQGFDVASPASLIGSTTAAISINIANSVMFFPSSLAAFSGFFVAPATELSQSVTLSPAATNYVELDQTTITGAPDTRSFWDPSASGGVGAEFTQIVDTAIFLKADVSVNTVGFSADKIPIAKVVVNSAVLPAIVSITDCRPMFFRLGTGGTAPNPLFDFVWPNTPPS